MEKCKYCGNTLILKDGKCLHCGLAPNRQAPDRGDEPVNPINNCPVCGTPQPVGVRFCNNCGASMANQSEGPQDAMFFCAEGGTVFFRNVMGDNHTGHIEVPAIVDDEVVKGIFLTLGSFSSISFPQSVVRIRKCQSPNLTELFIPDGVKTIDEYAFSKCYNLSSLTLPKGLTIIPQFMCADCSQLSSIIIPNSVVSIELLAFVRCKQLHSIIMTDSVVNLGEGVFQDCESLYNIILSNSLVSIGEACFYRTGIQNIVIPNSVKTIGHCAFAYCERLQSVVIPNSVEIIDSKTFFHCNLIRNITIGRRNYESIKDFVPKSATISFID